MENKTRIQQVREHDWGVYVWDVPGRGIVADDNGNYLSIPARYGDIERMRVLRAAAIRLGIELGVDEDMAKGSPKFIPGARQISQSEFEDQMEMLEEGYDPDIVSELDRKDKSV